MNELLHQENRKIALIVNDMGSINVDADILQRSTVTEKNTNMVEMTNGCICCTMREEFMQEIENLSKQKEIDAVFVEASGISDPASIAESFLSYEEQNPKSRIFLSSIVTVVDADRIYREFMNDLNHADQHEEEDEEEDAEIVLCTYGKVDANRIVGKNKFNYDEAMNSSTIQKVLKDREKCSDFKDEYGISSFVYEKRRPFDRNKLMSFLENEYPDSLIRAKGYIWFADDDIHMQLFEQAGRNATITEMSNWVASFDEKDKQEVFSYYPEVLDEWDEVYGDRLNQIVFIGKNYDKTAICNKLDQCLKGE